MDNLSYSTGLTPLQTRLIDTCRSLSEDEKVFIGAKDLLRVIAIEDLDLDDATFEEECEELETTVAPIEDYEPDDIGYVYRVLLQMGLPWHYRYPYFDLGGMIGDYHDEVPFGPDSVELRLSKLTHTLMPVGKNPLLPIVLLNGLKLADGSEVPPHNLEELWMAMEHVRQEPNLAIADLMEVIPGPDFGPGGVVVGIEAIRDLYTKGEATLTLRGQIQTEIEGGRTRVAITSLPHGVLLKTIIDQIQTLKDKNLFLLYDFKNASKKMDIRIVLDVSPKVSADRLKKILYCETDLERSLRFRCGYPDNSSSALQGPLISVLKEAVSQCSAAWVRKDGKVLSETPLLRDIIRFGIYKNPLSKHTDERRTHILEIESQ